MNIKTLRKNDNKKIILLITLILSTFITILCGISLAKYRGSKSISIARGTVNYKQADLNLVSVYLEDSDNIYKPVNDGKIPTSGYTLNTDNTKTRCEIKGVADTNITIIYENGEVSFSKLTTTGTKCYLYFDKIKDTEPPVIGIHEARNVEKTSLDLYVEATDNIEIAGYYFKLSTSSEWSPAKCASQNSCTHSLTGLTPNTSYIYDIKVCDEEENCSTTTITQKTKANVVSTNQILAGLSGTATDDTMFSGINGDGVYTWTKGDYSGGTQIIKYFRGNVDNNWVVFGRDGSNYIWWRIIRNNSNGSLRMIYAGTSSNTTTSPATTGVGTQIGTKAFNSSRYDNMYVGFKYTSGQVHGTGTNSTILGTESSTDKTTLYGWYNGTLAKSTEYSGKIDLNAGFCNDRTPHSGSGTGETETKYAAYNRLENNKSPSLLCTDGNDIFKTPVGLITADEVSMGGMVSYPTTNKKSYLYTKSYYWTMTPQYTDDYSPNVFIIWNDGCIYYTGPVNSTSPGVRPVVNLKSDTLFTSGDGTSSNPYVVCD